MSLWKTGAVVFAAAEQQSMVIGHAVVVNDEARVVDPVSSVDQLPGALLTQRLRRDHEVVNRHYLPGRTRLEISEVSITGQHNE